MQAGYLLGNVLAEHPGMKPIVVAEVQRFMFRPGLQERARYYAVVFLNQLQLSHHPTHGARPQSSECHLLFVDWVLGACHSKTSTWSALQEAASWRRS
jgi:hypothetical protein